MIDRIILFSIKNKLIVSVLIMGLIGWGIYAFTQLPIDAVPDITDNQIQVITTSPSLAAQEVEQFITFPLEMELGNIPKVVEIRSISRFGLSVITVVFEEDMDIYLARQLIGERIQAAEAKIPKGLGSPGMGPITTGLGEIYQYTIFPEKGYEDKFSPMDLRTIQDWIVKRQLVGIEGVIEINSLGGYLKQYEIALNPDKLKSMSISLPEVFEAVEKNNANIGGSYIEKDHYTYFIRGEGLLKNNKDIENIVVKTSNGFPILIKDIATVQPGHAPRFGAVTMNGIGEVVAGQVLMLKGGNAAAVTKRVKERMKQVQESLPEGVRIEPYLDRTKLVNRTTQTVITNLVEGGLIVIFVLVLLLGNLRAGLIVASVIPLSMLFAGGMMHIFGVSANLMSLGAIDFGLIVDGAVIIVEAILHHLGVRQTDKELTRNQMDEEVFASAARTRKSAAFGEIIILIVYIPILFLTGVEGKMFQPMAQTVSFAILGALILSLTYVPMMSAFFLSKKQIKKITLSDRLMNFLQRGYGPVLNIAMNQKRIILFLTTLLFVGSLWVLNRMGGEFIPTLEEGDFALHQILTPGSSIAEGVKVSAKLQNILLDKFPEVEKVVTKIGTAEIPTDIMPLEAGDIFVIMKPKKEWTSARTREEMFKKMEEEMNQFPGVMYEFTQPIQMRFNELMTGVRQDIAIKIYGENLGILAKKGKEAKALIERINGVGDIQVEPTAGLQQMVIDYDRKKIAKYGLNIHQLNQMVRGSFAGETAGFLFEGEKRFDVVVRLDEPFRQNISDLKELYIPLANGNQIPLDEVADIRFEEGPTQISRDNTHRRIVIGVNARGADVQSLVANIRESLGKNLDMPSGYYITYGGQFENLERARARLSIAVPVAMVMIFLLLYITFGSTRQAVLIFTAIPLSAIGGIGALWLRGMPFSISAGVGFIALFGVAVLNGIVLIAYFNQLKSEGMEDLMERIREGTKVRLRPVIMTAAVASLGFLPMAISTAAGAEVQQPLATVVIGGLVTATLLTLIILPILYYYAEKFKNSRSKGIEASVIIGLLFLTQPLHSQDVGISLNQAKALAAQNYPSLKRDNLTVEQQRLLSNNNAYQPRTSVFVSGEEIGEGNSGVQSFGFLQNFNLPSVRKSITELQNQKASLAEAQVSLTQRELDQAITQAYFQFVFVKQKQALIQQWLLEYQEFERIAQVRFENGETGKMPLLAATTKLKSIQLMKQQSETAEELAHQIFNRWLFSDSTHTVNLEELPYPSEQMDSEETMHPLLQYAHQQVEVATANVKWEKNKLQPQIQMGGQIQMINGTLPFWGYQVGLNLPLFRKGFKENIEAAKLGIEIQKKELSRHRQTLDYQRNSVRTKLTQARSTVNYLNSELLPSAQSQVEMSREAYQQEEISYLAFVQSLDQVVELRLQLLEALKSYQFIFAEWEFWE
ncbi:UNVERIFIED_CONTAM: hypothetical protein GTU68_006366 [Idotea baltica]|nr:hypothetical protein [Idotea baltica]